MATDATPKAMVADAATIPIWWGDVPRPELPVAGVPERCDAVVVGSGYAGLSAALTLARGGRDVVVLEAEEVGIGASTRNGGAFGTTLRPSLSKLIKRYGEAQAVALYKSGRDSWDFIENLIATETIDCNIAMVGRFLGAHTPADYESLGRELDLQHRLLGTNGEMIPRSEQHRFIGSEVYYGGRHMKRGGNLHPAKLHQGILDAARSAGASVIDKTPVTGVKRDGREFVVHTGRGTIRARDLVMATNGYTGGLVPWLARRLIPARSQIIATEPISENLIAELIPDRRQLGDTCRLHHYFRTSPDGRRIYFGGRAGNTGADTLKSAAHLAQRLVRVFPKLAGTRITHTWSGFIAFTFDELPHMGSQDGMHYIGGCCGSGVAMSPYLGHKTAERILGVKEAATVFDNRPFETRPLYSGNPWFLPAVYWYFGARDSLRV